MDETRLVDELKDLLNDQGIESTVSQREVLVHHLHLVIAKNEQVNLTRISDPEAGLILHVLDSLLLLSSLEAAPKGRFLDIGTGAGYPGIPLGIMSGRQGLLVDSVGKKVDAVVGFIDELGFSEQLACAHIRAEDLGRERPGAFTAVVARAVAQANVLVEYATPLLEQHGRLVITKGNVSDEELRAGDSAAEMCGLRRVSRETYELPQGMGHREVISYERIGRSQVKLPRKPGDAKRHPLGV